MRGYRPYLDRGTFPHTRLSDQLVKDCIEAEYLFASRQSLAIMRSALLSAGTNAALAGLENIPGTYARILEALPYMLGAAALAGAAPNGSDRESAVKAYRAMVKATGLDTEE